MDLTEHACLGLLKPEKLNTWPLLAENGEWLRVQPDILSDNGETLKQLAIQGCGVACISSFITEQDVLAGKLVCVLEKETHPLAIPIHAVFYGDSEMSPRLRSFLDYLVEHIHLG